MRQSLQALIPEHLNKPRWDFSVTPSSKSFCDAMKRIHPFWVCYRNLQTDYWELLFDRGAELYRGWADSRYKVKAIIEGEDGEPCQPGGAHIPLLNYYNPKNYGASEKTRDFMQDFEKSEADEKKEKVNRRKDRAAELNHGVLRALHEDEHPDKSGLSAMLASKVGTRSTYFQGAEFNETTAGILVPKRSNS